MGVLFADGVHKEGFYKQVSASFRYNVIVSKK
jgi:hypothetical protein